VSQSLNQRTFPQSHPDVVDIRSLDSRDLDSLLRAETVEWRKELDWDFTRSADLIRQCADSRSLTGAALLDRGAPAGYGYTVVEEGRGIIANSYVLPAWRGSESEAMLFRVLFDCLRANPQVRRIESQLPLAGPVSARSAQDDPFGKAHQRMLLSFDCTTGGGVTVPQAGRQFRIETWGNAHQETAAGVIALAYRDHVDSGISDQYRTLDCARRSLSNVVQYQGCGEFFPPGTFVAFDKATGETCGVVLATLTGDSTGHIAQICVAPAAQRRGLGQELLRRSIEVLGANGARTVTLIVTAANHRALALYLKYGFKELRRFYFCAWEGWRETSGPASNT
jgi:ribosomal protein S18 acetylase RimI-like enzyme